MENSCHFVNSPSLHANYLHHASQQMLKYWKHYSEMWLAVVELQRIAVAEIAMVAVRASHCLDENVPLKPGQFVSESKK